MTLYELHTSGSSIPCRESDPDVWHSERVDLLRAAKAACSGCSFRMQCLRLGMTPDEFGHLPYGTWGGLTKKERNRLRRRAA